LIYRISKNDPGLKNILWTGWVPEYGADKQAILKTAVKTDHEEVFFEIVDRNAPSISLARKWFTALRAISLTATATPALVVLLSGVFLEGFQANRLSFWLSFISVLLLQIAVNVLNDVEDHVNLVDAPGDVGGSGVIQKGWITARSLATFGYASLFLAGICGIYPFISHFLLIWPIALLSLVGVIGYSGKPFRFKYRAMGDVVVFLLCGPFLAYGFSVATFGRASMTSVLIGLVFGLAAVGILHANNLNDLEIDLSRGARTIANRIGFESSKRYLYSIYFLIALSLFMSLFIKQIPLWFSLVPFLVTPAVIRVLRKVKSASGPLSSSIIKIRFDASQIHLMIGVTWLFGFFTKALWIR
jgi:1,4-dihydroxy-2-naphthoate octaprenyltransferase